MRRIERLRQEAIASAGYRGHKMARCTIFYDGYGGIRATSVCKRCGMGLVVITKPNPNDIDISGEAIALNCSGQNVTCHACHTKQDKRKV